MLRLTLYYDPKNMEARLINFIRIFPAFIRLILIRILSAKFVEFFGLYRLAF